MSIPNEQQQYTYENASHLHVKAPFRPAQLTQSHNLKGLFRLMKDDRSKAIFGVGQGIPSVFLSKVLAQAGADFVWMDGEHSLWDRSAIHDAIHAIHHHSEGKTFVFVRVPKDDEVFLTACLDAGVDGIMLPHTESAEEVKELADKIYYPPLGKRSFSPWTFAPGVSGHSIYPNDLGNLQTSNNHIALIAQVESVKGIENLEEICSNPLIDSLLFGPGDFRADAGLSLLPSGPDLEPVFKSALEKVAKVTSERKIVLIGAAHDPAMLPQVLKGGARAIVIMFDYWFISQNVSKMVADGHKTLAELGNEKSVAN